MGKERESEKSGDCEMLYQNPIFKGFAAVAIPSMDFS